MQNFVYICITREILKCGSFFARNTNIQKDCKLAVQGQITSPELIV